MTCPTCAAARPGRRAGRPPGTRGTRMNKRGVTMTRGRRLFRLLAFVPTALGSLIVVPALWGFGTHSLLNTWRQFWNGYWNGP